MRATLKELTLTLVRQRICTHGALQNLADAAGVSYHKLRRWHKGLNVDMDADAVQRLYETITGKQLDY